MTIVVPMPLVAAAILLAGAGAASAYDSSALQEGEVACSSLCRSWMSLGAAPAEKPAAALEKTAGPMSQGTAGPVAAAGPKLPASHGKPGSSAVRKAATTPHAKIAVRAAAGRAPKRDMPAIQQIAVLPSAANAAPTPDTRIAVPAPEMHADAVHAAAARAADVEIPHAASSVEASGIAAAATVPVAETHPPTANEPATPRLMPPPSEPQARVVASGTPLSVKSGFYVVLALLALMACRTRPNASWTPAEA